VRPSLITSRRAQRSRSCSTARVERRRRRCSLRSDRLVAPFSAGVVERVLQNRGRSAIVFGSREDKGVEFADFLLPALRTSFFDGAERGQASAAKSGGNVEAHRMGVQGRARGGRSRRQRRRIIIDSYLVPGRARFRRCGRLVYRSTMSCLRDVRSQGNDVWNVGKRRRPCKTASGPL
jgi:hypothetical protein